MRNHLAFEFADLWQEHTGGMSDREKLEAAPRFLEAAAAMKEASRLSAVPWDNAGLLTEFNLLMFMPQDADYGESGMTVSERSEQINAESGRSSEVGEESRQRLINAPPDVVDQYFERVDTLGTKAAREWLLARPE